MYRHTHTHTHTHIKVNVNLSLRFYLPEHHTMKAYCESEGIAPRNLRPRH